MNKDLYAHKWYNWKRSWGGCKVKNAQWDEVELISLHIPKTAGTSFYHMLRQQYGDKNTVRLDVGTAKGKRINMLPMDEAYIGKKPKVVHGHFTKADLYDSLPLSEDIPIITWLRDPVERVISNYYYLGKILDGIVNEKSRDVNILSKMQKSLTEYAQLEQCRNRLSKFLDGLQLKDLAFVGIVEHFDEDSARLAKMMGWKNTQALSVNRTGSSHKRDVDPELRKLIAEWNSEDIALYQKVLSLRP